jgi:hypothetical protein
MQLMRGILRIFVVGFTVISLLLVAAVAVAANSGTSASSATLKNSVVAVFSGHASSTGAQIGTSTNSVVAVSSGHANQTGVQAGTSNDGSNNGKECLPHGRGHHHHATGDRENDKCGGDDSGSS